ncbi:MAG: ribonuclease domain-containing protein [Burkholderiales bacterium]
MIAGVRPAYRRAFAVMLASASVLAVAAAFARDVPPMAEVKAVALPKEAREVLVHIHAGGPFRYDRDGVVFGNFEHLLPARPRGYYHEYTVRTPGTKTRGARRIVCGGPKQAPDACFYSDDHYSSFRRIAE